MALTLGIDTGGTYTDAVLFDTEQGVVAAAKALTTKHDLTLGIAEAADAVLDGRGGEIALVSVSTTLATNAIVEGQGSPAALVLIGHAAGEEARPDLARALAGDPTLAVAGGHDALGEARCPLDTEALAAGARAAAGRVSAFAVSSLFSVRNPEHEIAARDLLHMATGLPISCGHELSQELDAPRRALTALINARLLPLIQGLIQATARLLDERGVTAPLMVVKGDGSLTSAATALRSPVETILSGPAASVVGALHLSGIEDALVADMGGTTTDIAPIAGGRPSLAPAGASVGGYRTMVKAVAVHSCGLGGDSEVGLDQRGRLRLGPRRAVPLALAARRWPAVLEGLRGQRQRGWPEAHDGIFVLRQREPASGRAGLSRPQRSLLERLEDGPVALEELYRDRSPKLPLERLLERGLAVLSRFTPSDAAHLLGLHHAWNGEAAALGAALWLRWWALTGHPAPDGPQAFAALVLKSAQTAAARALMEAAMAEQHGLALPAGRPAETLLAPALEGHDGGPLFELALRLRRPVVAVGAAAATYYPEVGRRLATRAAIPPHAHVCNAVGAVAGSVTQRAQALVTAPEAGLFRCHLADSLADFDDLEDAARHAGEAVARQARQAAEASGAAAVTVEVERHDETVAAADGSRLFIESRILARATGRPALAAGLDSGGGEGA